MALVRALAWHVLSARNKRLQAGYKQVASRLQRHPMDSQQEVQTSSSDREHVLPRAGSRTKSVGIRHLVQSSFQANFKSMPKRAHLDLHILGMSGECPGAKGFSEYVWAAEGLSVPCPAFEAQHLTIPEVQNAASILLLWLLEELAPPRMEMGCWWPFQPGTLGSALEPGTDRAHEGSTFTCPNTSP